MADALSLADIWIWFARECDGYSPLYTRIARAVAADAELLTMVQQAPPRAHQPNVLLAAVHALLLGGLDHPLGAVYAGASDADPAPLFLALCREHWPEVLDLMTRHHTNTNEVGRSAVIGPALTAAAATTGAPIALIDVGCSAGLNLVCDRYLLDYGAAGRTGPADAALRIECSVAGGAPPIADRLPTIGYRRGLDRDPVDVRDEEAARWLLACIWPDTGRLDRARLAIDEARRDPPVIVAGDMVASIEDMVAAVPADLVAVVLTTWSVAYLSREDRVAFRERLTAASGTRRVVWISADSADVVEHLGAEPRTDEHGAEASVLGLTVFRAGAIDHAGLLAYVQPHGAWIDWVAR